MNLRRRRFLRGLAAGVGVAALPSLVRPVIGGVDLAPGEDYCVEYTLEAIGGIGGSQGYVITGISRIYFNRERIWDANWYGDESGHKADVGDGTAPVRTGTGPTPDR